MITFFYVFKIATAIWLVIRFHDMFKEKYGNNWGAYIGILTYYFCKIVVILVTSGLTF